jgi:hypothetical protein
MVHSHSRPNMLSSWEHRRVLERDFVLDARDHVLAAEGTCAEAQEGAGEGSCAGWRGILRRVPRDPVLGAQEGAGEG